MTIKVSDMLGCICLSCIHDLYFNDIDLTAIPANDAYGYRMALLDALFLKKEQKKVFCLKVGKALCHP